MTLALIDAPDHPKRTIEKGWFYDIADFGAASFRVLLLGLVLVAACGVPVDRCGPAAFVAGLVSYADAGARLPAGAADCPTTYLEEIGTLTWEVGAAETVTCPRS